MDDETRQGHEGQNVTGDEPVASDVTDSQVTADTPVDQRHQRRKISVPHVVGLSVLYVGIVVVFAALAVWSAKEALRNRTPLDRNPEHFYSAPVTVEPTVTGTSAVQESVPPEDESQPSEIITAPGLGAIDFTIPNYSEGVTGWEVSLITVDSDITKVFRDVEAQETMDAFKPIYEEYAEDMKEAFKKDGTFTEFDDFTDSDDYQAFQARSADGNLRCVFYVQTDSGQEINMSSYSKSSQGDLNDTARVISLYIGVGVSVEALESLRDVAKLYAPLGGTYTTILADAGNAVSIQCNVQNIHTENEEWTFSASRTLKGPINITE